MKYTKAQLTWGPGVGDKVTFDLDDVSPTAPYIVKSITGLEPTPKTISIGDKLYEGGVFQGQRSENREIVMLMSFQPNYAIGENAGILRKKLYAMLSPKLGTNIIFKLLDDAETDWVQTTGQIKRMENNMFSKDPELQITMSCLSAYFSEAEVTFASPATLSGQNPLPITNPGDVPMGITLAITLTSAMSSFTITSSTGRFLKITYAFLANDKVFINTNPGFRSIKRVRSAVADLNMLPYTDLNNTWLMLDQGLNNLVPSSTAYTVQSLIFTPRHWGF